MIEVRFKNFHKSEMVRDAFHDRIEPLVAKFTDLSESRIQVTLELVNSPLQAGPDLFSVKLHILGSRYSGITVEKSNSSMYIALAEVVDHMLEVLNRFGDRNRVKERKKARQVTKEIEKKMNRPQVE